MSAYRCESCGHDGPLSEPCPICETAVREALAGRLDGQRALICVPFEEAKAVMERLDALRVEHAALIEQVAQRNRELQTLQTEVKESATAWVNCDTDRMRLRAEIDTCREALEKTRTEADKAITEATFARSELKQAHAQILKLAMDLDEVRKR